MNKITNQNSKNLFTPSGAAALLLTCAGLSSVLLGIAGIASTRFSSFKSFSMFSRPALYRSMIGGGSLAGGLAIAAKLILVSPSDCTWLLGEPIIPRPRLKQNGPKRLKGHFSQVDSYTLQRNATGNDNSLSMNDIPKKPKDNYLNAEGQPAEPPIIAKSDFLPDVLVTHLMTERQELTAYCAGNRSRKYDSLTNEGKLPDRITNMEGALRTFIVPIAKVRMTGDYIPLYGSPLAPGIEREVILSTSIHPDFYYDADDNYEGEGSVFIKVVRPVQNAVIGKPFPKDFVPLAQRADSPPGSPAFVEKLPEYENELHSYMVYYLTKDRRLPSIGEIKQENILEEADALNLLNELICSAKPLDSTLLSGKFIKIDKKKLELQPKEADGLNSPPKYRRRTVESKLISLEILYNTYLHQMRNEFSVLEHTLPQGYVYTVDALESKDLGAIGDYKQSKIFTRLQLLALKEINAHTPLNHLKYIGLSEMDDTQAHELFKGVFGEKAIPKLRLYERSSSLPLAPGEQREVLFESRVYIDIPFPWDGEGLSRSGEIAAAAISLTDERIEGGPFPESGFIPLENRRLPDNKGVRSNYIDELRRHIAYYFTASQSFEKITDLSDENLLTWERALKLFATANSPSDLQGKFILKDNSVISVEVLYNLYLYWMKKQFTEHKWNLPKGYIPQITLQKPTETDDVSKEKCEALYALQSLALREINQHLKAETLKSAYFDAVGIPPLKEKVGSSYKICPVYERYHDSEHQFTQSALSDVDSNDRDALLENNSMTWEEAAILIKNGNREAVDEIFIKEGDRFISIRALYGIYYYCIKRQFIDLKTRLPDGDTSDIVLEKLAPSPQNAGEAEAIHALQALILSDIKDELNIPSKLKQACSDAVDLRPINSLLKNLFGPCPTKTNCLRELTPASQYLGPKGVALVEHNYSDAFGHNLGHEGRWSKSGVMGCFSNAGRCLDPKRKDLLRNVW